MSAKMMTVNTKPDQYRKMAKSPTGCGANMPMFRRTSVPGLSTRKATQNLVVSSFPQKATHGLVSGDSVEKVSKMEKDKAVSQELEGTGTTRNLPICSSSSDHGSSSLRKNEKGVVSDSSSGTVSPVSTNFDSSEYSSSGGSGSGDSSPVGTPVEPGSFDTICATVDRIEQELSGIIKQTPRATIQRASRAPEQMNAAQIVKTSNGSCSSSDHHCDSSDSASPACTPAETQFDKAPSSCRMQFRAARCEGSCDFGSDDSRSNRSEVLLHVYEIGVLGQTIHNLLKATMGTGAYHVGVEVYGREICYGSTTTGWTSDSSSTGVSMQQPRSHPFHRYCGSLRLGQTGFSQSEVKELIAELKVLWPADKYHSLRHNCVSFAEALCGRLGVSAPPEHVGALAKRLKDFWF